MAKSRYWVRYLGIAGLENEQCDWFECTGCNPRSRKVRYIISCFTTAVAVKFTLFLDLFSAVIARKLAVFLSNQSGSESNPDIVVH